MYSQQVLTEETLLQQRNHSQNPQLLSTLPLHSTVYLEQVGDQQQTYVQNQGLAQALILQAGYSNYVLLTQFVDGGIIHVTQLGVSNYYEGTLTGEEMEASLLQQGEHNTVWQHISGSQFSSEIVQQGFGNEIQQQSEGVGSIKIYQRGNDMKVIIKSNN